MNEPTYDVYTFCENCLMHKKIEIPKGNGVAQTPCPNCGTLSLKDDPNGELFDRPVKHDDYY